MIPLVNRVRAVANLRLPGDVSFGVVLVVVGSIVVAVVLAGALMIRYLPSATIEDPRIEFCW